MIDFLSSALVTLLITIDPPGLVPVFLTLTRGMSAKESLEVGIRACIIALCILAFFALGGGRVLELIGISLPAFRIGGGLLLFSIAFEMVFEKRTERKQNSAQTAITEDHIRNIATFPLAIPLMAGPGSITAVILLSGSISQYKAEYGTLLSVFSLVAIITICIGLCFATFLAAKPISRFLGITGNIVLSRLLGVVLAGLAVQFVIDGILEIVKQMTV